MSSLAACGAGSPAWMTGADETPPPAAEASTVAAGDQAAAASVVAVENGSGQSEPGRALAERAKAGCRDSFEQLVRLHENHIFNFIRQLTRNRQDAEDLTQETFIKAYRSLDRYLPSFAFAPWLFTIARRTAASHFRAPGRFEELAGPEEADLEDPSILLERKDERNLLWDLARTPSSASNGRFFGSVMEKAFPPPKPRASWAQTRFM